MKKWIVWFSMIPICAMALSCCYEYMISAPLKMNIEPMGLLIFIPIFYVLCIGADGSGTVAGKNCVRPDYGTGKCGAFYETYGDRVGCK